MYPAWTSFLRWRITKPWASDNETERNTKEKVQSLRGIYWNLEGKMGDVTFGSSNSLGWFQVADLRRIDHEIIYWETNVLKVLQNALKLKHL
jgi:hypothetical protein